MSPEAAKKFIKIFSLVWAVLALVLAGLAVARILSLESFQWVFASGFAIWSVVVTIVFRFTQAD